MSEIHVCYEWEPPRGKHYHATGQWNVAGVVEDTLDAELWVEPDGEEEERKYRTMELNNVSAFFTEGLSK